MFITPIKKGVEEILGPLYKDVFSGSPWYEDLACRYCKTLYTKKVILPEFSYRVTKLEGGLSECVKCGKELDLIPYYPGITDQRMLISEAIEFESLIGYILFDKGSAIGFNWGYKIPTQRTQSVNFPLVRPLLESRGISCETAFYGAETGILEEYQGKGLGAAISAARGLETWKKNYKSFILRTINPRIKAINTSLFSNKKPEELFNDPETNSPWIAWRFEDFNPEYAYQKLQTKLFDSRGRNLIKS